MISLRHNYEKKWFDVYKTKTLIGHIWHRNGNTWIFEADRNKVPPHILSEVERILEMLSLKD